MPATGSKKDKTTTPKPKAPKTKAPKTKATPKLEEYRAKRDFSATTEPAGGDAPPAEGRRFVVQRHRARRLHYDFRLEVDGVLASWAVPKGPTLDPKARRLAVHVEDHPIEYADFEGIIPQREYGGGDVIVWDRGTWTPMGTDDPAAAIANGDLHFELDGQKLKGRFVLVRRGRDGGGKEQWLLLKKRDESAQPGWDPEDHPQSVKTGRTNDETAANPDAAWDSHAPADRAEVRLRDTESHEAHWAAATDKELDELAALAGGGQWEFQGRVLTLTNLDRVLFPARDDEGPVTKRDLVRAYATTAPSMLPYLVHRPVNLHRYPNGIEQRGFWLKDLPSSAPDWITRWHHTAAAREARWYFVVDSPPALAWMADNAAVEIRPWASTVDAPSNPTWALVEIDPGTRTTFAEVIELTQLFRTALDHLGVVGMPMVGGQRGIQVWIPVAAGYTFDDTRAWVEKLSRAVGATVPELVSWERGTKRGGRARLDFTQNAMNKTLLAPFSPRPAAGAPVSVPISWEELEDPDLRPDRWTLRTVVGGNDPLARLIGVQQRLPDL